MNKEFTHSLDIFLPRSSRSLWLKMLMTGQNKATGQFFYSLDRNRFAFTP